MKRSAFLNSSVISKLSVLLTISVLAFTACRIEPPLHLPQEDVRTELPIVVTDLEVVWNINSDLIKEKWWYGWDAEDERIWGKLEYPQPTYYEVRRFYQGITQLPSHTLEDAFTVYGNSFRRRYNFGYYDLLVWSNIDSKDGTQVLLVDEKDVENIIATTTKNSTSTRPRANIVPLQNQPEVFYSGFERNLFVPRDNFADYYDYFDNAENAWVKKLTMTLDPMVYIYLVQVVIYNNNGKVRGLFDNSTLTGMAGSVNINTGWTSKDDADLVFGLRMKQGRPVPPSRTADIMGGMITTFGLCDIAPWQSTRGETSYTGSRADLPNNIFLGLQLSNATQRVYSYDVTDQVQSQIHGGIITIEIDADTINFQTSGGFIPNVGNYGDSITHEFVI